MADESVAEVFTKMFAIGQGAATTARIASPGATILTPDEAGVRAALILRGIARIFLLAPDGRRVTARYARPGALVGSLTTAGARGPSLGVDAVTECELLELDRAALRDAAQANGHAAWALVEDLERRLHDSYAGMAANAFGTMRERVARHLLDSASEVAGRGDVVASITQQQLADSVGTVREVVARILGELREEGLVSTSRGQIRIVDLPRFAALLGIWRFVSDPPLAGERRRPRDRAPGRRVRQPVANGLHLLVVDDDPDMPVLLRALLGESLGPVFLDWAPDAATAGRRLRERAHDIVIMDQQLPDGTGVDLVREFAGGDQEVPVIMLTGREERQTDLAAMTAGAVDFIRKSELDGTRLERAVRYALSRQKVLARSRHDSDRSRIEATTDPLTGLGNRRRFDDEFALAVESGRPFALVLADIDGLKDVNDRFGHPDGDRAITAIGAALKRVLRRSDRLCRIGGDEFAAIVMHGSIEAIRKRLETDVSVEIDGVGRITASVGITEHDGTGDGTSVYRAADDKLRLAKGGDSDRNRIGK